MVEVLSDYDANTSEENSFQSKKQSAKKSSLSMILEEKVDMSSHIESESQCETPHYSKEFEIENV